jgi:hypothetical protein
MLHSYYVGHFDPPDPVITSVKPLKPKVQRPPSPDAVIRVLEAFDPRIAEFVFYDGAGYVGCSWSRAPLALRDQLTRFARALAEAEGAVVMLEAPGWIIELPHEAGRRQESMGEIWTPGPARRPQSVE